MSEIHVITNVRQPNLHEWHGATGFFLQKLNFNTQNFIFKIIITVIF